MVLLGKLLRTEFIELYHFLAELAGILEPLREEHDLCDHRVIGDHHRDRPEQTFQVVGELGPACVAWVHSDEAAVAGLEGDTGPLEDHLGFLAE
jgi:hypothetical protein